MEITTATMALVYKVFSDAVKTGSGLLSIRKDQTERNLSEHLMEIEGWSATTTFFGMSTALKTDAATIPLQISTKPRRFARRKQDADRLNETELLQLEVPVILLGDPGSGKTTTIKRLVRHIILHEPLEGIEDFDFPILLRARDFNRGQTLYDKLSQIIGIEVSGVDTVEASKKVNNEIKLCLTDIMRNSKVLLAVDGIDEVEPSFRDELLDQIQELASSRPKGNIIATCRSGDFAESLNGFSIYEILGLEEAEIEGIVRKWSQRPDKFMAAVKDLSYRELLDRPLFLCHIIVVFDDIGTLPERPSEVYRLLVNLMIEKWDMQRRVIRGSYTNYGKMSSDRKRDFLSSLAMHLLNEQGRKQFSEADLEAAYVSVFKSYNLKRSERSAVVREIESHTGLIVESSFGGYEFSHFSLQEYLCADYIVRQPTIDLALRFFRKYREPIAIAICLSSDPSRYFAQIMMALYRTGGMSGNQGLYSFLGRLSLERPHFEGSRDFGMGVLCLISMLCSPLIDPWTPPQPWSEVLLPFSREVALVESLTIALDYYQVFKTEARISYLSRTKDRISFLTRTDDQALSDVIYPGTLKLPEGYTDIFGLRIFRL